MTIGQLAIYSWLQYSFTGDRYTAPDLDPVSHQDSISIINASVTVLGSSEGWKLIVWGKNITDEEYTHSMFDSIGLPGNQNGYPGDPRTYGMTLKLSH
jgi:iron complex outermembrane receptor protein